MDILPAHPCRGRFALAGAHFAVATCYLIAASAGLVWIAPQLAAGDFASPRVAGVTHLFTLGWLTITIFGALYQLMPNALAAPIRWPRAGYLGLAALAPGVGTFALGVALSIAAAEYAGITLVALGVALAVANVAATLPRARRRDEMWAAIAIAITYLSLALVLGAVLFHNLRTGAIAAARLRVLATHLHVAIVGWVLVMIVGVSHRLLPMFLIARGADTRWTRRALASLALGVPCLGAGLTADRAMLEWLGAALLEVGVACFLVQASRFYRARVRKRVDIGMRFVAVALGFLAAAAALGVLVLRQGPHAPRLAVTYVLVGLLGGVVMFVVGIFYKIVPMMVWTARYGGQAKPNAPTIAEMFSEGPARVQLVLLTGALLLLPTAVLLGSRVAATVGATAFSIAMLLMASVLTRLAHRDLTGPSRSRRRSDDGSDRTVAKAPAQRRRI